jgi:hypothetical protein
MNEKPPNWVRLWDQLAKEAEQLKIQRMKKEGGAS